MSQFSESSSDDEHSDLTILLTPLPPKRQPPNPKCSIPSEGSCNNNCILGETTCIAHKGFERINSWKSSPSGYPFLIEEPINLYEPRYLERWLISRDTKWVTFRNCGWNNFSLINLVREELEEDEKRNKLWKTNDNDGLVCHIDFIPKECLFQILSFLDVEQIVRLAIVRKKYMNLVYEEIIWKNKIFRISSVSRNSDKKNFLVYHQVKEDTKSYPTDNVRKRVSFAVDLQSQENFPKNYSDYLCDIFFSENSKNNALGIMFVSSVEFGILCLFDLLLPVVQERKLWEYHSPISKNWIARMDKIGFGSKTLIEIALHFNHKPIIQRLLEICFSSSISKDHKHTSELDFFANEEFIDKRSLLVIGSIEDNILFLYLNEIIINFDQNTQVDAICNCVSILIDKIDLEGMYIWTYRLEVLCNTKRNENILTRKRKIGYFRQFCGKVLVILCRIDEYNSFVTYFRQYRSMFSEFDMKIFEMISETDYHPFRYLKFLECELGMSDKTSSNMMLYKNRWSAGK